jgi:hypothetical protein
VTSRARLAILAVGLVVSGGGCSIRPSDCPCFERLLQAARCAGNGGRDLGYPSLRAFRGRFVTEEGPTAGWAIALEAEGSRDVRIVATDPAGGFDAGRIPSGSYRFVVCRPGTPGATGWVEIRADLPDVPLELDLTPLEPRR